MRTQHPFRIAPLALAAGLACSGLALAQAVPHGATVINGTATINTFSNGMQVINSPGTILNWQGFSIGNGQTVRFDQVNAQSSVLNRVTGNAHSDILGTLQSNGRVFLLNPNGIVFGAGSVVDTAGLIASTLNISDEDFLAGNYRFSCFNAIACEAGVDVLNPHNNRIELKDGSRITTRTAGEGGQVWLIARERVESEKGSTIDAPAGQVMGATAREVTVTSPSLGQMSFTLTGTVGSRIDLSGDIDVARGAAGFFADTVRLAGGVRARSDASGAGQIAAQAASKLAVEGDARLDVSGTAAADAGAVRLSAVQQLRVAASAEIAADGGSGGGQGGLILLQSAEVILPALLGVGYAAPVQIHARGFDTEGLALARYGRVDVQETGTFDYQKIEGVSWSGESTSTGLRVDYSSSNFSNQADRASHATSIWGVGVAGDGRVLLVTLDNQSTDEFHYTGANGQTTGNRVRTWNQVYELHVIDAQGQRVSTQVLATASDSITGESGSPDLPSRFYSVLGLSKGGWVLRETGTDSRIHVISAQNGSATALDVSATATLRAMLSGGFIVEDMVEGVTTRTLYSAAGVRVTDAGAVSALLAGENLTQPLQQRWPGPQNFDERRTWRVADGQLQFVDLADDSVERSLPVPHAAVEWVTGSVGGSLLGTRYVAYIPSIALAERSTDYGAIDGGVYTPLAQGRNNDTYFNINTPTYGESLTTTDRLSHSWMALGDGSIGNTWESQVSRLESSRRTVGQTTTASSDHRVTEATGFDRIQRTLTATPAAAQGVVGRVLASPLLASMPGQSNGTAGGGGTQPPVDPGPGTGNPGTGGPGTPPAPGRTSDGELPPPAYFPGTRPAGPAGLEIASAPIRIPASAVTDTRTQAEIDAEILAEAERLVGEYMGPQDAARFAAARTDEERRPFMKEVAYAMTVGQEVYDATRSLGEEMRSAMFNGWGTAQLWGMDNDDEDFSTGLMKAMTEKLPAPPNEDGSPGVPRTRLQVAFDVADLELKQAKTKEEKDKIGRRVFRDMVHAARAASGQEVDPDADLVLSDGNGGTVRINDEGDMVYEKGSGEG
ncbi:MAG: filamentous hemagglutinin N-terminal domain-containing protein [Burkholderiaceae bacterium]|nr:filamentous hemagglutinin N-terminal domain-containing protein [Burkholderiaceae bacterium]